MNNTIIKPHLSEKSFALASRGYYTFVVDFQARKKRIGKAIADFYNVHVVDVRTAIMPGKTKRAGKSRLEVATSPRKKAMVRLAPGEKIDAFEITKEKTEEPKEK